MTTENFTPDNAANMPNIEAGPVVNHVRRVREGEAEAEREAKLVQGRMWLISFTDLFSLLLCFFMMMYTMKDPDLEKVGAMGGHKTHDLMEGAGKTNAVAGRVSSAGTFKGQGINQVEYGEALNLDYLQGVLRNNLKDAKIDNVVRVGTGRDHLKLLIDESAVFSGNAVSAEGVAVIRALAGRLSVLPNAVMLIARPRAGADWADGFARAEAVATVMRSAGYHKAMVVTGETGGGRPGIEMRVAPDDGIAK